MSAEATYAPLAQAGLLATSRRVQEMHHAIAGKTFRVLKTIPVIAAPSGWVESAHDTITDAVYAGVRAGGSALLALAAGVERSRARAGAPPASGERGLRNALNAAFGDRLDAAGNTLAIPLQLLFAGRPVLADAAALRSLSPRVAVWLHGLGCDERSWSRPGPAWDDADEAAQGADYGALLQAQEGFSAVYLRYNTGLAITDNATELGTQLAQLLAAAPQVRELALIGHSMGGLVARVACEQASAAQAAWVPRTSMIICLGSPHQGAPLEKLGRLASVAMGVSEVTRPLARLADSRSRGVKDLRHGLGAAATSAAIPLRLVSGSLAGESGGLAGRLVDRALGDGLVRHPSAADHGLGGDVQRAELRGVGHMGLLRHPKVYALIRDWLRQPRPPAGA
ncbi:MAG TPA: hypothetical protein VJ743_14830 [Albitalea sp.]|nr:hypothetical protein [Albitalea sp.]